MKSICLLCAKIGLEENEEKKLKLRLNLEKKEKYLRELSEEKRPLTYDQTVVKIYKDYESLCFNLSEVSKNETMSSIKQMSLGQRIEFENLIIQRINRNRPNTTNE